MKIAILGPGRIGGALAGFFVRTGHEVMLCAYRDEDVAFRLADSLGARLGNFDEARAYGEVFMLCVPHPVAAGALRRLAAQRAVIVDCTNQFGGELPEGFDSTSEYLASQAPGCTLVKAFNTLRVDDLRTRAGADPKVAMIYSTDSEAAAGITDALIRDCGFDPLRLGALSNGVLQEPGGPFFLRVLEKDEAVRMINDIESTGGFEPAGPPH